MNSESTLSDALSEVDTALAASDNERAAGLASELLLAYPNAVAVLRQRASALAASSRSLQAAEVHRRVLEILPADGEAMAGLARTLHTAGQTSEARDAARQALDYLPGDESLKHIAAGESQPFQPDDASMLLRKSLAQTQVGLLNHGIAGLRQVASKWPDRVDAKVALMQALWHNSARITAAEQAQAVLDEYPNCLNAHLLMLQIWRAAGNSDMERIHQQAIDQVDPDHRVAHAMMGTQSPLQVKDVPARPSAPAALDEEALSREDWVDNLVAASLTLPKPLEQLRETETQSPSALVDDIAADVEAETGDETDFVTSLLPLEWSAASDLSEESARDDFAVSWIDGDVKDEFSPARPRTAVPDPRDGVPEALDPLEWEVESDETAASAQTRQDFSTMVDGGIAKNAADAPSESDFKPLKTLAAAGAIAAAKQNADDRNETELAGDEANEAQAMATVQQPLNADSPEAQESLTAVEASATVEPADATSASASAEAPQALTIAKPAAMEVAPAETAVEDKGSVMKAVAAATALGTASKKRKKPEAEEARPAEQPTAEDTRVAASAPVAVAPAEPAPEAIAPAGTEATPARPAAPKRAKKPAAKPSAREVQTEKVRKTYERAIASTKREDMPKLITELNQAAEMDPDNKIIFELLGQAYNRSGDIPAAINAYRRALEL